MLGGGRGRERRLRHSCEEINKEGDVYLTFRLLIITQGHFGDEGRDQVAKSIQREHISDKANVTADYLSRAPCISETDCEENEYDDDVLVACLFNSEEPHSAITKQEWEEATRNDNVFTEMKKYIMEGWPREKRLNETLQPYWKIKNDITIVDEVFLRGETLIAPMSVRGRLVALAHEGHVGMTGTKQKLRERYWWPAMDRDVDIFVSQCSVCDKADKTMSAHHCPMLSVELPEGPWIKIGIDFIGPMNGLPLNMRYAIVIIDYFSKWIEVKFVSHPTTSEVTTFLQEVFCKEGFPRQLGFRQRSAIPVTRNDQVPESK
ncbi:hypothetical protein NDU88_008281 [Pleurodeles waltl]|uniref:Gypsy retrotransposon integrase-like protein 1 n=1 Tax=Pleurodeles waltl TaxID=8319 RepID=A0AAV7PNQ6_PLEWA|nr:hypothetical protein NDU88_008281 [Pleurodeles waltl]